MRKIKHLNIEYNNSNTFELFNKVNELTKGNNIDLLISITNDIEADFYSKVEKILERDKIEYHRNDYDFEKNNLISKDFEQYYNDFNLKHYETKYPIEQELNPEIEKKFDYKYISNPKFTDAEMLFHYRTNSDIKYFSAHYHLLTDKTLAIDYFSIRYEEKYHTKELEDYLDYIETISNYFKNFIYTEYNKITLILDESETMDLSNSTAVEKIIYLNELGIIDFLRAKPEFALSTNLMATVLSAISGENLKTLQPILNPLISKTTAQKNNPYNSQKTVNKVRQTLIDKNIKPKTS